MFLLGYKADAGGDRSPWGDFWFSPIGMQSASGARVTPDTAMQLSAVFRAVLLISSHIGMLPIKLKKAGTNKVIKEHGLYRLWKRPNRWQGGMQWRMMIVAHLLLRGNAYNEIIDNARGEITELIPLHPDRVKVELLSGGDWRYRVTNNDGTERVLLRGQVWHLRGLSTNGITGISVIEAARESLGLGLSAQNFGARFFANDARPVAGWIGYPGKFADKAARQNFREQIQEAQAAKNRGKMMVLDQGMEYHEVGLNNRDSQFLESRKFEISEIARWFGVPPHKLADLDRATFSNIEQQALEYVTDSLLIWAEIIEDGVEADLLFDNEEIEPELDFSRLLRGDKTSRYRNYQVGINAGFLTRNEAREDDLREPIDGLDEPLRPLNMVEESQAEDEQDDTGSSDDGSTAQPDQEAGPVENEDDEQEQK